LIHFYKRVSLLRREDSTSWVEGQGGVLGGDD